MEFLAGPSLAIFKVINWAKFVLLNTVCQKRYENRGFSTFLAYKENCARVQIFKVINWAKLAFFLDPQLGPVNNFDLAQLTTLKNGHFVFWLLKMC